MVDEQDPPKRVVKRVVKKTVVRPASDTKPTQAAPRVRYGRPVGPSTATPTKVASRPVSKPSSPRQRQRVDLRSKVSSSRQRAVDAWWVVADGVTDGTRAGGRFVTSQGRQIASWRLPQLNPYLASVITGTAVGLVAVCLGFMALRIFEHFRGVSSGGGILGSIAFIAISVAVCWLGRVLLAGFGILAPQLTSVLALLIAIAATLGLFIEPSQGSAAILLFPALGAMSYPIAHWLISIAESAAPDTD